MSKVHLTGPQDVDMRFEVNGVDYATVNGVLIPDPDEADLSLLPPTLFGYGFVVEEVLTDEE